MAGDHLGAAHRASVTGRTGDAVDVDLYLRVRQLFETKWDPAVLDLLAERPSRYLALVRRAQRMVGEQVADEHIVEATITRTLQRLQQAGLVPVYLDRFQEAAEKMIDQQLEWDQLQAISEQLWPLGDDDGENAYLKRMARERDLKHLFEQAPTQENIRGTALAGYNAVVEWLDHHQPARGDNHRAHKVLTDGAVNAAKEKAFALLMC
jgi:hypothetical protein